jgi:hypothetical protein
MQRAASGHGTPQRLFDVKVAACYIEERFLDYVCRHPSPKARRMEEKSRQTPLGMTARGDALVAPASSRRFCASVTAQKIAAKMAAVQELRGGSTGGTCTCGQMYLSQVQSVVADAPGHFAGTMGLGEKTL